MRTLGFFKRLRRDEQAQSYAWRLCFRSLPTLLVSGVISLCASSVMALPSGVLVPLTKSKGVSTSIEKAMNTTLMLSLASKVKLVDENKAKKGLRSAKCKGTKCLSSALKVAQGSQARFVFIPSLVNEFDIYALKLTAADSDYPKKALIELESSCEFCSEDDLKAKFKSMITSKDLAKALNKKGKDKGPTSFTLAVITSPKNAEVFIDGKRNGRTPLSIANLKAKSYKVTVKLKGYVSQTKRITPPNPLPSSPLSSSFTLKPKAPTSFPIIIKTNPKGANVVLDGVKIKVKTPFKARVQPGAHEINFSLKGYEDLKQTFNTPSQAETISVSVTLKKIEVTTPKGVVPSVQPKMTPSVMVKTQVPPRPSLLSSNWSGAALGVGAIMTGVGAWLLSVHGEVTCNDGRTRKTCPDIYDTKVPGGMLLGTGTAAIGASIITLLIRSEWPLSSKSRVKGEVKSAQITPSIMPTIGGAAASFSVNF